MIIKVVVPSKGSIIGILTFLGCGAFVIALLKGIEKECRDPLSIEPRIQSTRGLGWHSSIIKGDSQCLNDTPCFCPPLGTNHSKGGWMLRVLYFRSRSFPRTWPIKELFHQSLRLLS